MKFNNLFKNKFNNWAEIEKQIEGLSTTKERGDVFEEFVHCYLELKKDLYQIDRHFMAKEIPIDARKKYEIESHDCGIDGLIYFRDGKVGAYQVKFRTDRKKPGYDELTKFWAEARHVDFHFTIANTYELTNLSTKNKKHISILVDEFENLDLNFFEQLYNFSNQKKVIKKYYKPDDFQNDIINSVVKGFKKNDRGKLIAACGTGKTLTSLWITEKNNSQKILFLAPSLALIKQTLEVWAEQAKIPFSYLCVCSDNTVSAEIDSGDISIEDLNIPVTTSPDEICKILTKTEGKFIVFSTYQSLDVLSEGINKIDDYNFDLIIFDEAHRTAGNSESGLFSLALENQNIPATKRLFMTATERLVKPSVIQKAKELNRVVFSMDDEKLYGPVFYKFSFGEAIEKKIISDYRIIIAGIRDNEVYEWIKSNKFLTDENNKLDTITYAQNVFKQIILIKAMKNLGIKKCISFHSSVKYAKEFISGVSSRDFSFEMALNKIWPELGKEHIYMDHINGSMSAGKRKEMLDYFNQSQYGLISNARCLTEGVDVPVIDSIYFVDKKNSLIDIVQACGRALRKPRDKHDKVAYFLIPVLLPENSSEHEAINNTDFEMLHNLIQSLRDQDQRLEQWIDNINLDAIKGKTHKFSRNTDSPIVLNLPTEFNVKQFEEQLYLRIADVNKNPTSNVNKTIKYGKKERKSDYKRIFKTLGDYSVLSYKEKLVLPTIKKYSDVGSALTKKELSINHNNLSHTERLGLLVGNNGACSLSPIGKQLYENKTTFEEIFKHQMLRYFSVSDDKDIKRILFPYRACLKVLLEAKSISFHEFVFSLYSMVDSSKESINEAVENINYLRQNYPNIDLVSTKNKTKLLNEINEYFRTNFNETDIWNKKTTIVNQFIYFRNHLALFDKFINIDEVTKSINLNKGVEEALSRLLDKDSFLESENDERQLSKYYQQPLVLFILYSLLQLKS